MRMLVTGSDGFTGRHFLSSAKEVGWEVVTLTGDLTDKDAVNAQVLRAQPSVVVHLAAISAVTHGDIHEFYRVNLFGTLNLLDSLNLLNIPPKCVLLASSANVYGNTEGMITESMCPKPVNHYAMSKLAMEHMAMTYASCFPITIARPFNYTGVGQGNRFVIPKIVDHFARGAAVIELGDLSVEREYNDVRTICDVYLRLLKCGQAKKIYNICSGISVDLNTVIEIMVEVAGYRPEIKVAPAFVRPNEIKKLCGSPRRLEHDVGYIKFPSLRETLVWMFESALGTPEKSQSLVVSN